MFRALFRTGLIVGSVSAAAYIARKYFRNDFDKAVDTAKSTFKDISSDLRRKDKAVTSTLEDVSHKAI